jgi:hypothetical protein
VLGEMNDRSLAGSDCDLHHIIWMIVMGARGVTLIVVFMFAPCINSIKALFY